MFRRGDLPAEEMKRDLNEKWYAVKSKENLSAHALGEFVERARETVSTADSEFATAFRGLEKRYQRIQPGIHAFQDYLADLADEAAPLVRICQKKNVHRLPACSIRTS